MVSANVIVFDGARVPLSVHRKVLMDRCIQDFNRWLFNSKVSHLNIKTMEVDSLKTFTNIVGQTWLTNFL